MNYSNILRIKIKNVYVKGFLISTKVRLNRGEHLYGEEPIYSEPTFRNFLNFCEGVIFATIESSVSFHRLKSFCLTVFGSFSINLVKNMKNVMVISISARER